MATQYRGYAQRTKFDAIQAPNLADRELRAGQQVSSQLRENLKIKQQQDASYQAGVQRKEALERQNRAENFQWESSLRRANRDAEMRIFQTKINDAENAQQGIRRITDALQELAPSLMSAYQEYDKKKREALETEGAHLIYKHGLTWEEVMELRTQEAQVDASGRAINQTAEAMLERGVPGEVVEKLRTASGSMMVGAQRAMLMQAGQEWPGFRNQNYERTFDVNGQQISLADAERSKNGIALRSIDGQLRREYLAQFNGVDPKMMDKYMFAPMREFDNRRYAKFDNEKTEQMQQDIQQERNDNFLLKLKAEGGKGFVNSYMADAQGPQDVKRSRREYTAMAVEAIADGLVTDIEAQEMLDAEITINGDTKTFEQRYPSEADDIRDAMWKQRQERNQRYGMEQREKQIGFEKYNDTVRESLNEAAATGELRDADLEQLQEKMIQEGNNKGASLVQQYRDVFTVEAQDAKAAIVGLEDAEMNGYLTTDMVRSANLDPDSMRTWMGRAQQAEKYQMPEGTSKAGENFIKSRLATRAEYAIGQAGGTKPATLHRAEAYAIRQFQRDFYEGMRRFNGDTAKAEQYALGNFEREFGTDPDKGLYAVDQEGLMGNELKNFGVRPTARMPSTRLEIQERMKQAEQAGQDPLSVSMIPKETLSKIITRNQKGGALEIPNIAFEVAALDGGGGVSPLDVVNAQLAANGLPPIRSRLADEAKASGSKIVQQLINYHPTQQRLEIANLEMANQGSGFTGSTADLIASGEGGYNSVNRRDAGDTPGGAMSVLGRNLTDMTISEIQDAQRSKVFAVGKFQIIPPTMPGFVRWLQGKGINPKTQRFTPQVQDMFWQYTIEVKRPKVGAYLRGESSDLIGAAQELAREFASVGNSIPENGNPVGVSRYAGSAGNAASISPGDVQAALQRDRSIYRQPGTMRAGL